MTPTPQYEKFSDRQLDIIVDNTRNFIDDCFSRPDLHEHLQERKPTLLVTLNGMAMYSREQGRLNRAHYIDDMMRRLEFWQYD